MSAAPAGLTVLGFAPGDRAPAPDVAEETTLGEAASSGRPVLALYRAPWTAFLEDREAGATPGAAQWLREWIDFHHGMLELHQRFPGRVILVNAARLGGGQALRAHLRELGLARDDGESDTDREAVAGPGSTARALQSLLASGMASACPEAWTLYEELESRALLLGREPEFRGAGGVADFADPGELLSGFAALDEAILREREEARALPPPPDPASDALRRENELLGLHLEQLLEELQFHSDSGRHLRRRLQEAGEVSEAARLLISEFSSRDRAPG